jgi:hypothetical protein
MAEINRECYAFYDFIGYLKPVECYILKVRASGGTHDEDKASDIDTSGITKRF